MKEEKLPDSLTPYTSRLQSLYEPKIPTPKRLSNSGYHPIDEDVLKLLTEKLNKQEVQDCEWMTPAGISSLSDDDALAYSPVQPRGIFYKRVMHNGDSYSTFTSSKQDSFVVFKDSQIKGTHFGRIFAIFDHRRSPTPSQTLFDTWVQIQRFPEIPTIIQQHNPFSQCKQPDALSHLRAWGPTEQCLVKLEDIVAHCTWLMFRPGEVHPKIKVPTVGLTIMER